MRQLHKQHQKLQLFFIPESPSLSVNFMLQLKRIQHRQTFALSRANEHLFVASIYLLFILYLFILYPVTGVHIFTETDTRTRTSHWNKR